MFPQVALSDLTYTDIRVAETYDGSHKGKSWTGAWITLLKVKADGGNHILPTVEFEVGGDYGERVNTIGFKNYRTVTQIDPIYAYSESGSGSSKVYHVLVNQSLKKGNLGQFLASLKAGDQETIKAICGSLSDKEFVEGLISKIILANRFGDKYKKYWSNKLRVSEIVDHAKQCNRGLGQKNSNAAKFVLASNAKNQTQKLCGYAINGLSDFSRSEQLKKIQSSLKTLGYYKSTIDGAFGKNSCTALINYFNANNIKTSGDITNVILENDLKLLIYKGDNQSASLKETPSPVLVSNNQSTQTSSAAENSITKNIDITSEKLSLENEILRQSLSDRTKLINKLKTDFNILKTKIQSSKKDNLNLKNLNAEQEKLAKALKDRNRDLENKEVLAKSELVGLEQEFVRQSLVTDDLKVENSKLSSELLFLRTQNKKFQISELETRKLLEKLGVEQRVLQEQKESLVTSNEALKVQNSKFDKELKKLNLKSLFEGGLSRKPSGSGDIKKDDAGSAINSLGDKLISKKLIKNLQNDNSKLLKIKNENSEKIKTLTVEVQNVFNRLASAILTIDDLKKDANEKTITITALQTDLITSKTETQSKVEELEILEAKLSELQSYKAEVADKEAREIENSKLALKNLFENKKVLVLSSASNEAEVNDYIIPMVEELGLSPEADTFDIFLSNDGLFSITLGLGSAEECSSLKEQLLSFGSISESSFCGDWKNYIAAFDYRNGKLIATIGKNYFANKNTIQNDAGETISKQKATDEYNVSDFSKFTVIPSNVIIPPNTSCEGVTEMIMKDPSQSYIQYYEKNDGVLKVFSNPTESCARNKVGSCKPSKMTLRSQLSGDTLEFFTDSKAEKCTVQSKLKIKHGLTEIFETHSGDCKYREFVFESPNYTNAFLCLKNKTIKVNEIHSIDSSLIDTKHTAKGKGPPQNGQGTYTYPDGRKYSGEWRNKLFNGQGTLTYANGDEYIGEFNDGKISGQGIFEFAFGRKYAGEFKNGKLYGQGTLEYTNGNKYVGEFKNGRYYGTGTLTYADGRVKKGMWKNGRLQAPPVIKKLQYKAVITCRFSGYGHTNIEACFTESNMKLTNDGNTKVYTFYEITRLGYESKEGFHINLSENFSIEAQNSKGNYLLGITIYNGAGEQVYQDEVGDWGVIRVGN